MAVPVETPESTTSATTIPHSFTLMLLKRLIDVVGALGILLLITPLAAVIIIVILAVDYGPIFYAHERIGRGGRPFGCIKFRTMRVDADVTLKELLLKDTVIRAEWEKTHKLRYDPRVTSLGRLLRKTSLDELPQVINVLRGDMSLVGPRPVVLSELLAHYRGDAITAYTSVRPGITGLWQVSGRSDVDYRQRVSLDCQYINNISLRQDLFLLIRTVSIVARRNGAY